MPDSTASEESEEFSVTRKKSCRKAAFSESESGSFGRGMLIFVEWEGYLVAPVVRANFREQSWPLKQAEIVKVRLVNIKIKNTAQTSNSNVIKGD